MNYVCVGFVHCSIFVRIKKKCKTFCVGFRVFCAPVTCVLLVGACLQIVVVHDSNLKRITGLDASVEDLEYSVSIIHYTYMAWRNIILTLKYSKFVL